MKLFTLILSRIYEYTTVCIVIGSPLFFIPKTIFSPEATYHITMMVLITIALSAYVVHSLITKSWHHFSKIEFVSYIIFFIAIVLSSLFSRDVHTTFFGEGLLSTSGASLLSLPVVIYLVRALRDTLRRKLKYIMMIVLGLSAFIFVAGLIFAGNISTIARQFFSGFSGSLSFVTYLGIFVLICFFFTKKLMIPITQKAIIVVTAIVFVSWLISFTYQDSVRPNFVSTITVGKDVMIHDGPFGIGAGNFIRAWQLYRPDSVIASQYFGYEFTQGADTMSTFFVIIGILGLLSFLTLVLSALYGTYLSYKETEKGIDHFILGIITIVLLYFACLSWLVPFSYSLLITWMVVAGLGIARSKLTEYNTSKHIAFILVPTAILFIFNTFFIFEKVNAFLYFGKAQTAPSVNESINFIKQAEESYAFDGFYRAEVEYIIQANRSLFSSTNISTDDIQKEYIKKTQSAINAALSAVKINPDNYQNYVSLGRAYEMAIPFSKNVQYINAKNAYEQAVKLYPENPYLYLMLARLEASTGNKDGAQSELTQALQKKRNFADALYLMSQLSASNQKIDEAISYALEAIKNAPNDPTVYTQAGLLFYGKKDYQNAITSLKTALEKDPNNENIAYFLSLALINGGRPDIAKPMVEELIKRNPGDAALSSLSKYLTTLLPATVATSSVPVVNKK